MAPFTDLFAELRTFVPWVSLLAGLAGSLHCVGMCGGLVASSCGQRADLWRYQVGRLLGYLSLGAVAGFMGGLFTLSDVHPWLSVVPSLLVGSLFLFWGLQALRGKTAQLPMPRFLGRIYQALWQRVHRRFPKLTRAFFTGFISILLPCGLLYGVIAATVATQAPLTAMLGMLFFWLGTLPAMLAAPGLVRRILRPLRQQRPTVYALSLMVIGVLTIGVRVVKQVEKNAAVETVETKSCH